MKKIITISLLMSATVFNHYLNAQDLPVHEFGIQLSNLQGFGMVYKKERDINKLARLQLNLGDYTLLKNEDSGPTKQFRLNLSAGKEKRKPLNKQTFLVHGFAPFTSIFGNSVRNNKTSNLQLGVAYVLGIQYRINNKFYISAESMPALSGVLSKQGDSDTQYGYNIGFYNSNPVNITLAHRFRANSKKPK